MVMIYTQRECKNDCFEDQIVTISNLKVLGMVDHWGKTITIRHHI